MPYATDQERPARRATTTALRVKNSATYEALITKRGMSKSQAAAISNAALKKGAKRDATTVSASGAEP